MEAIVRGLLPESIMSAIEKEPAIYNNVAGVFERRDAWDRVVRQLMPCFDEKTAKEKSCLGKFCHLYLD